MMMYEQNIKLGLDMEDERGFSLMNLKCNYAPE